MPLLPASMLVTVQAWAQIPAKAWMKASVMELAQASVQLSGIHNVPSNSPACIWCSEAIHGRRTTLCVAMLPRVPVWVPLKALERFVRVLKMSGPPSVPAAWIPGAGAGACFGDVGVVVGVR